MLGDADQGLLAGVMAQLARARTRRRGQHWPMMTAQEVDGPAHGLVAVFPDGSFLYLPDPGFTGTDSFTYASATARSAARPAR